MDFNKYSTDTLSGFLNYLNSDWFTSKEPIAEGFTSKEPIAEAPSHLSILDRGGAV